MANNMHAQNLPPQHTFARGFFLPVGGQGQSAMHGGCLCVRTFVCVCMCVWARVCACGCARVYVCACVAMLERPGGGGLRRKNGKQYAWYLPAQHTIDAGFFLPGGKEQSAMHGGCVCMCVRTFVCLCVCASGRVSACVPVCARMCAYVWLWLCVCVCACVCPCVCILCVCVCMVVAVCVRVGGYVWGRV